MPRGVYKRKKSTAARRSGESVGQAISRSRRRVKKILKQNVEGLGLESEFLTHGSTHAREQLSEMSKLKQDYTTLRGHAVVMANFIAQMTLMSQHVPGVVRTAAANVVRPVVID